MAARAAPARLRSIPPDPAPFPPITHSDSGELVLDGCASASSEAEKVAGAPRVDSLGMIEVNWLMIADRLTAVPGARPRNSKQCRERWQQVLDPMLDRSPWCDSELGILEELVRTLGTQWLLVQRALFLNRGDGTRRSCLMIRNAYWASIRRVQRANAWQGTLDFGCGAKGKRPRPRGTDADAADCEIDDGVEDMEDGMGYLQYDDSESPFLESGMPLELEDGASAMDGDGFAARFYGCKGLNTGVVGEPGIMFDGDKVSTARLTASAEDAGICGAGAGAGAEVGVGVCAGLGAGAGAGVGAGAGAGARAGAGADAMAYATADTDDGTRPIDIAGLIKSADCLAPDSQQQEGDSRDVAAPPTRSQRERRPVQAPKTNEYARGYTFTASERAARPPPTKRGVLPKWVPKPPPPPMSYLEVVALRGVQDATNDFGASQEPRGTFFRGFYADSSFTYEDPLCRGLSVLFASCGVPTLVKGAPLAPVQFSKQQAESSRIAIETLAALPPELRAAFGPSPPSFERLATQTQSLQTLKVEVSANADDGTAGVAATTTSHENAGAQEGDSVRSDAGVCQPDETARPSGSCARMSTFSFTSQIELSVAVLAAASTRAFAKLNGATPISDAQQASLAEAATHFFVESHLCPTHAGSFPFVKTASACAPFANDGDLWRVLHTASTLAVNVVASEVLANFDKQHRVRDESQLLSSAVAAFPEDRAGVPLGAAAAPVPPSDADIARADFDARLRYTEALSQKSGAHVPRFDATLPVSRFDAPAYIPIPLTLPALCKAIIPPSPAKLEDAHRVLEAANAELRALSKSEAQASSDSSASVQGPRSQQQGIEVPLETIKAAATTALRAAARAAALEAAKKGMLLDSVLGVGAASAPAPVLMSAPDLSDSTQPAAAELPGGMHVTEAPSVEIALAPPPPQLTATDSKPAFDAGGATFGTGSLSSSWRHPPLGFIVNHDRRRRIEGTFRGGPRVKLSRQVDVAAATVSHESDFEEAEA